MFCCGLTGNLPIGLEIWPESQYAARLDSIRQGHLTPVVGLFSCLLTRFQSNHLLCLIQRLQKNHSAGLLFVGSEIAISEGLCELV